MLENSIQSASPASSPSQEKTASDYHNNLTQALEEALPDALSAVGEDPRCERTRDQALEHFHALHPIKLAALGKTFAFLNALKNLHRLGKASEKQFNISAASEYNVTSPLYQNYGASSVLFHKFNQDLRSLRELAATESNEGLRNRLDMQLRDISHFSGNFKGTLDSYLEMLLETENAPHRRMQDLDFYQSHAQPKPKRFIGYTLQALGIAKGSSMGEILELAWKSARVGKEKSTLPNQPMISGDKAGFVPPRNSVVTTALAELIRNALDHGNYELGSGDISVNCYFDSNEQGAIAEHYVVSNPGTILEKHREFVFKKGFSTLRSKKSHGSGHAGKGLAILKDLAHEHGGSLEFSVAENPSTVTFSLKLPHYHANNDFNARLTSVELCTELFDCKKVRAALSVWTSALLREADL